MSLSIAITGASSGIGEALALAYAARGARLCLMARRAAELERVAAACAAQGAAEVRTAAVDVTDRDAVHRAFAAAETAFDGLDVVVLNAGISEHLDVAAFDDQLAARILDVNLTSLCYALGAVMPGMVRRRRGQLVGVGSLAGYRGMPGASAYCASKAGLAVLLESLRVDLRRHGVDVTLVSPGFVRTPLTQKNRHPMPFLMDAAPAAEIIVRGIERRRREVRFPWRLATLVRLLRALPDPLYDVLARRVQRPPSAPSDLDPYAGAG